MGKTPHSARKPRWFNLPQGNDMNALKAAFSEPNEGPGHYHYPVISPKRIVERLGERFLGQLKELRYAAAVVGTIFYLGVQPRVWDQLARRELAREVLAIGVEPVLFVAALAVFLGISVVVQLTFWTGEAGQSQLLGPLLVTVVAREIGPVLINLVVIVRSGSAMTTELGVLKIN